MASKSGVTYTGMTNDLIRRVAEHKQKAIRGFTAKYNIVKLVYYEDTHDVRAAIAREKQIKAWRRQKKVDLIEQSNPKWVDLTTEWSER
ncbi:MAG: GIY-YIG nuclease family protein [SAR324 cluster bacterium]|nr:GIY-YIG nuclease family protein [SAR324 cluster bacterium]